MEVDGERCLGFGARTGCGLYLLEDSLAVRTEKATQPPGASVSSPGMLR